MLLKFWIWQMTNVVYFNQQVGASHAIRIAKAERWGWFNITIKTVLTSSTSVLSSINGGIISEQKRLTSPNLSETYCHRTGTRPPICMTPQQPTVYKFLQRMVFSIWEEDCGKLVNWSDIWKCLARFLYIYHKQSK